jgi:hypothetical protein
VHVQRKSLLVRADFVLGAGAPADRRTIKRWRGILKKALPGLLGCQRRCPEAVKVRLRGAEGEPHFSGWLRIPVQRRPGRKRVRQLRERLRRRLEASLLPIGGSVVKLGVRRCRGEVLPMAAPPAPPVTLELPVVAQVVAPVVTPVDSPTAPPVLVELPAIAG